MAKCLFRYYGEICINQKLECDVKCITIVFDV